MTMVRWVSPLTRLMLVILNTSASPWAAARITTCASFTGLSRVGRAGRLGISGISSLRYVPMQTVANAGGVVKASIRMGETGAEVNSRGRGVPFRVPFSVW